jgi:hypothetical protein
VEAQAVKWPWSRLVLILASIAIALCVRDVRAQGTFQNLNFESANNLPTVSPGQTAFVPATNALPGWAVYEGGAQESQVLYNGISLGAPLVTLVGPNTGPPGSGHSALVGNYSATIDDGEGGSGPASAAIGQTAVIPGSARSLTFLASGDIADTAGSLAVTFNGQNLAFVPLAPGPNYEQYGCDISALAGQAGELRFAENPVGIPIGVTYLDDIAFSAQSLPEPGTLALLACGAVMLGQRWWMRKR